MAVRRPELRPWWDCAGAFRAGTDTPRAFLERCLAAVAAREAEIGAFVHIETDAARAAADRSAVRWREGRPGSPIDGMPVGIKDIIETADMPTQNGSPLYAGWRSGRDAASVAALREAGAVILGKTVTTEFATTEPRGTRNPCDPDRTPGGSSSGSAAAVAAGMLPMGLGTQVVGSILRPASFCGAWGYKPTVGAINRGGSHDGLSQSAHGPIAASLEDAWLTAREIAARAGGDPGCPALSGPFDVPAAAPPARLAVLESPGWAAAGAPARTALGQALERIEAAGVVLIRRSGNRPLEDAERALAGTMADARAINAFEMLWPLNVYRERAPDGLSAALLARLDQARALGPEGYRALLAGRERVRLLWQRLAAECDAAITLSAPGPAPLGLASTGDPSFNVAASYLGTPAIGMPLLEAEGLPLGLQLIGFAHGDASLFAIAAWIRDTLRPSTGAG